MTRVTRRQRIRWFRATCGEMVSCRYHTLLAGPCSSPFACASALRRAATGLHRLPRLLTPASISPSLCSDLFFSGTAHFADYAW